MKMKVTETLAQFTPEECDQIILYGDRQPLQKNSISKEDDPYFRDCRIHWIDINPMTGWMFRKFLPLFSEVNISRMEVLQYTVYNQGMFCGWHIDDTKKDDHGGDRVATAILQLSGPDDYDGGELQILLEDETAPGAGDEKAFTVHKKKGSVIFFQGDVCHRVTKVTRGARKTLVCWGLK
jgi:PKHD-type hydroxylase